MNNRTWNLPGCNLSFLYPQNTKIITDFTNPQTDASNQCLTYKTSTYLYTEDSIYQIWDEYLLLTLTIGQLSQKAILLWKQRNNTYNTWANSIRHLG